MPCMAAQWGVKFNAHDASAALRDHFSASACPGPVISAQALGNYYNYYRLWSLVLDTKFFLLIHG